MVFWYDWNMQYSFCPKCGGALNNLKCTQCGFVFYQNSKPCVTGVIVDGDKVLLGSRAHDPVKGAWDLLGGFLETGEHPEDGLRREIKEETGLEVTEAKFLGMFIDKYPDYGYDTLNIAYLCEVTGEPKANDDVEELKWFSLNNLPELAFKNTIETIDALRHYLKNA